ncbi:2-oxoadipate dioxygenase/decarboxylase HglS [Methylobacterium oryzihabitans]|uniref:2-oxoadipate dioxygenase/decarboxylase n=1 Tax=Methylobacterium oryzihabitans TaxID=2499852 RepID=A0A3S3TZF5_9HYPH|nr:VOC family protein [Methylobacterium oryzihabitans]RVU11999.1 VOC family protein [Methylobacterium oryzihabitans]
MEAAKPIVPPDVVRTRFSRAMSDLYRAEVPQYGTLMELVRAVNGDTRRTDAALDRRLRDNGEIERLDLERHGAIRVGTAAELATLRRLFAVMGMVPVGYYDLSVAGVPVHSTAFRPVEADSLRRNPFRVFTSLLRLDLVGDEALRSEAAGILARRAIFTPACLDLIDRAEREGGLDEEEADRFVAEALETFRWHSEATVSAEIYARLRRAHPLVADIVCFKGPHINHLTPRTLDIDAVQDEMPARGIAPKAIIEGPPRRRVPLLLRQTSFRALREPIRFRTGDGPAEDGTHTARFGEIEQRGAALTRKGRALYDRLLAEVRDRVQVASDGAHAAAYTAALADAFRAFPDDEDAMRAARLAYFRYAPTTKPGAPPDADLAALVASGHVAAEPLTYEDFLPVSAAGIFSSNLGDEGQRNHAQHAAKAAFERDLGAEVADEDALYAAAEAKSVAATLAVLAARAAA